METLRRAVEKAGYTVGEQSVRLKIGDMTCASCVSRVEKALKQVAGVLSAEVNLATETAEVKLSGAAATPAQLIAAVEKAGYRAWELQASGTGSDTVAGTARKQGADWWPVALAAALSAPLALPMLAG